MHILAVSKSSKLISAVLTTIEALDFADSCNNLQPVASTTLGPDFDLCNTTHVQCHAALESGTVKSQ